MVLLHEYVGYGRFGSGDRKRANSGADEQERADQSGSERNRILAGVEVVCEHFRSPCVQDRDWLAQHTMQGACQMEITVIFQWRLLAVWSVSRKFHTSSW
jgi:hypothetical protein